MDDSSSKPPLWTPELGRRPTADEILALNAHQHEERKRALQNQKPMTAEEMSEQIRRNMGLTKEEHARRLANWEEISRTPPVRRQKTPPPTLDQPHGE
jgi:hypothetical protein